MRWYEIAGLFVTERWRREFAVMLSRAARDERMSGLLAEAESEGIIEVAESEGD